MGNIEQLSNLDNILWGEKKKQKKNGSHKDAARLLFVDGKCLENSESVRFQYKPLSLSLSFL